MRTEANRRARPRSRAPTSQNLLKHLGAISSYGFRESGSIPPRGYNDWLAKPSDHDQAEGLAESQLQS